MECVNTIFPIILYILGSVLLVVMIVVCFKVMGTIKKINTTIDDVNNKSTKLNGLFNLVDNTTDAISNISDTIIDFITDFIAGLFSRKNKKKEADIDERES